MRRLLGLAMAGLVLLSAAPATIAAAPVEVDPATLTPPQGGPTEWTCLARGNGIECTGTNRTSGVDVNPDPSFSCGGNLILVTFTQELRVHRSNDADGRVTGVRFVGTFDEVWRVQGGS